MKKLKFLIPSIIVIISIILVKIFTNKKIMFHTISNGRIGHFSVATILYLYKKKDKKYFNVYFLNYHLTSNTYLLKKYEEKIFILRSEILYLCKIILVFLRISFVNFNKIENNTDYKGELFKKNNFIKFNESEEKYGKNILKNLGVLNNEKFICINTRDDNYLNKTIPFQDTSYHNYRNTSISNFYLTAKKLSDINYKVIRIGKFAAEKINSINNEIIDYSFSNYQSDFMDVYLMSKCEFFIGGGSGLEGLAYILKKPCVSTNLVPLSLMDLFHPKKKYIFKHHYSLTLKRNLTLDEIFESGCADFYSAEKFLRAKIELRENSPLEIWNLTKEMLYLLKNNFKENPDNINKIDNFNEQYINFRKQYDSKTNWHLTSQDQIASSIGVNFLINNKILTK